MYDILEAMFGKMMTVRVQVMCEGETSVELVQSDCKKEHLSQ